jgi:hypothetical protein
MATVLLGNFFEFAFQLNRVDGGVVDADSLPSFRVYEDGSDVVIETGTCSKRDDPGTIGYYAARSQTTTAKGYASAKNYHVRVEATVDGVSRAAVIGRFACQSATDVSPTPATALEEHQAAYLANADYDEDGSLAKCRAFITACRSLLVCLPSRMARGQAGNLEWNVEVLKGELDRAQEWLALHDDAPIAGAAVRYLDLSAFRD